MLELNNALSWTRPLEHRETAGGYAGRLGHLHGRDAVSFLADMGINPQKVYFGEGPAVEALAKLGGCDASILGFYTPKVLSVRRFTVGNTDVGDAVLRSSFRYCPLCVEDDLDWFDGPVASRPWLMLDWQIDQVRACSRHRLLLIDVVPERIFNNPVDLAKSVAPVFSRLREIAAAREAVSETAFQDWVMRRIDGITSDAWLDRLSIPVAIGFCEALGIATFHDGRVKVRTLSTADLARASEEGFRVARGGEEKIRAHLETFVARQKKPGVWGMVETFGQFYQVLWSKGDDPDWRIPRDLLRDFAMDAIPFAMGTDILGTPVTERRIHTIYTAMTEAGRYGDFVRRLLERKGHALRADIEGLSDHKVVIDAAVLADTIEEMKSAMPTVRAAARLGMDRHHLSRAIKLKMIATVGDTNQVEGTVHWLASDAIEAFREKVFAGAVEIEAVGEGQVTITEARSRAKCSVSVLLKLIDEGGLSWKGYVRGNRRVDGLLFDVHEILRATERRIERKALTQKAACKVLGISWQTITPLIEAGELTTGHRLQQFGTPS